MVKSLKSFILGFVLEKIRNAFIIAAIVGIVIFLTLDSKMVIDYILGFIIGCINFTALSHGSNIILSAMPKAPHIINFLFFTLRYLLIAFAIIYFYTTANANLFAMIGGMITMNLSLIVTVLIGNLISRKEG